MPASYSSYKVADQEISSASKFDNLVQAVEDALNNVGDTTRMDWAPGDIFDADKIKQGGAATGQALVWNGTNWAPGGASLVRAKELTGDQSNSTTTLTEVSALSLTTGIGTFHFKYMIIHRSAATTTGVRFSVNHTGTLTHFVANLSFGASGVGGGSPVVPDQDLTVLGGDDSFGVATARAKSTTGWGTTVSADTANADMLTIIEGLLVCTVDGDIELWHGSEVAAQTTVFAGSSLIITKTSA
jgi:hypothetical protein